MIKIACATCGESFWRPSDKDPMPECFDCMVAYHVGERRAETKYFIANIKGTATVEGRKVGILWGVYRDDLGLWVCGLDNGTIGWVPKGEFTGAAREPWPI
jgi:hypothetical protein